MNLWKWRGLRLHCNFTIVRYFANNQKSHYDVLGVTKTATTQEIKQAFYKLSKKYHPDVVGSDSKRFLEIKEAYDTLKDEDKRRFYDSRFDSNFDPFNQRSQSDFSQSPFRNVRRTHEYRHSHHHYTQEEIDRIWKQFQEQFRNRPNADYDAEMRQKAREKHYNDFIRRRTFRWQAYADENRKTNPFDNPEYKKGCKVFKQVVVVYFVIFVLVAFFQAVFGPMNKVEEKIVVTPSANDFPYRSSRDRIKHMMETPPMNSNKQMQTQEDPNFPYGFPTFDRKD